MKKTLIDSENIKNTLYTIKDFPGITGYLTFDKNGDIVDRPMEVRIVKDGKFLPFKQGEKYDNYYNRCFRSDEDS